MSNILQDILPMKETSDMTLVTRLRHILSENRKDIATQLLEQYHFWYDPEITSKEGLVYWSENHYIMNCSSEILLLEMMDLPISQELSHRLHLFLDVKKLFGTSEWLSPVYLPFTIASLLNLYDFTKDDMIKSSCQILLDRISCEIMTVTSPSDGSIVSPSGRAYARHRVKTRGLHLNLFIDFLLSGKNIEIPINAPEMALRTALSTTTYRPSINVFTYERSDTTPLNTYMRLSSSFDDIVQFMEKQNAPIDTLISILWNYGAYIPQSYTLVKKVVIFMDRYNLWDHPHFKVLKPFRKGLGCCFQKTIHSLTCCGIGKDFLRGALLTNALICVHKEGDVVMSSLVGYNTGLPSFQQWPFAINLSGVPIWCAYGSIGSAGMSCLGNPEAGKELSTARLFPNIQQTSNQLVATYTSSSFWLKSTTLFLRPKMHWPVEMFDNHGTHHQWTWCTKDSCVLAYKITRSKVEIRVRDLNFMKIKLEDFLNSLLQKI